MKKSIVFLSIICWIFSSCEIINPEEDIPTYIHIDSIHVDYPANSKVTSSNIENAWVYLNGELNGVYELPATFPVLAKGKNKLTVLPGIKVNGQAVYRSYYPFLQQYEEELELITYDKDTVISIQPKTAYFDDLNIVFEEAFTSQNTLFEPGFNNTSKLLVQDKREGDNYYGSVYLQDTNNVMELVSKPYDLPTDGRPVYLEIDYNTDLIFTVGLMMNYSNSPVYPYSILHIVETEGEWKKIYINLTEVLQDHSNAESFQVFLGAATSENQPEAFLHFDNIRLIH